VIDIVNDCSYNVDESGNLRMMPKHAEPYKDPKMFKNEMSHLVKYFRFTHRTQITKGDVI
jgi:hypothetical protein